MLIELLVFDGCPTGARLLERLPAILRCEGIEDPVRVVEVIDEADAAARRFLGSPSLRIDGDDVEPDAAQRVDYGLTCRVYQSPDGLSGVPSDAVMLAALRAAKARAGSPLRC